MKSILPLLFLVLSIPALSQTRFSEGTILYDIVINTSGGDKSKTKNSEYLDGSTVSNYIKGSKTRSEMVSPLGTLTTIADTAKNSIVILREFGEQKYMITLTSADWKDVNRQLEGIQYTMVPGEEKTILGRRCLKAIGTLKEGTIYTVWYTPELVPENKNFQYETRMLPGLALEYEVKSGGQTMTYTASKINIGPVPAAKFDLPKSGYRVMTYAESKGKN